MFMASESPGGQGNPETGKARATQLDAAAPQEKGVPLKPRGLAGLLGTSAAIEPKATNLVASVVEDLKLARIKIDASVQCRAVLNKGIVANYAERMAAGDKFPPGVVFRVSGEYLLVDGWHRYEAAKIVGGKSFAAEVREGTRQEAIRFAVQANATHGLPRNNKDKHRAVELALRAFPKVSNRVIADFSMVSHTFVNHIRPELETVSSSDKRTGHDGKQRKAPKPRPRTSRKPSSMTRAKGPEDKEHTAKPERTGDKADEGGHQKEYFHRGEAWVRIESFLLGAIKEWPEDMLPTLSDQLHQFAERHCFAPPAKASGEVHAAAKRKPDKVNLPRA